MTRLDDKTTPPPPVRGGARKPLALIACGVIVASLLLVVVANIEDPERELAIDPETTITELITPADLTDTEVDDDGFDIERDTTLDLPAGGWIQIQNDEGDLAQQYRFERLEPNPEGLPAGWLKMLRPEAEIYLSDGRIVRLTGDSALAYAPNRALESGTITGQVVIRLFEPVDDDTPIDVERDEPVVTMNTDEAAFENMLGRVTCDGPVTIATRTLTMPGSGLRVMLNDRTGTFHLRMQTIDYVRLEGDDPMLAAATETAPVARVARDKPKRAKRGDGVEKQRPPAAGQGDADRTPRRKGDGADDAATDEAIFYRLTFHDDVRVQQGDGDEARIISGDELSIIFSMKNSGIDSSLAAGPPPPPRRAAPPHALPQLLAAIAVAATGDETDAAPSDQPVTLVTCRGGLTIEPYDGDGPAPASADDAMVELVGNPLVMTDAGENAVVTCAAMHYATTSELVDLVSSPVHPVHVDSPQLAAGGRQFTYRGTEARAGFTGAGWLEPRKRTRIESERLAAAHDGDLRAVLAGAADAVGDDELSNLRVTWTRGVDLLFSEATGGDDQPSHLDRAVFEGDVNAWTTEGAINSDRIELRLTLDDDGESIPDLMTAAGGVRITNPDQTVWADDLRVTFRVTPDEMGPAPDESGDDGASWSDGSVDVHLLDATGNVQVLLADGSRAFAETLHGDAEDEFVVLEGEEVVIISDTLLMERGTRLSMRRGDGTARWDGPGAARVFDTEVVVSDDGRIDRPTVDPAARPAQIVCTWDESMTFDSLANDKAGALRLVGDVVAESVPGPLEFNRLTGRSLTLNFARTEEATARSASSEVGTGLDDDSGRRLTTMIAEGDARLENRTWLEPDQSDTPRVFFVAGQHVEYDDRTMAAHVPGAGELLIRDSRPRPNGAAPDADAPFSARGTTLFRWSDDLSMTQTIPQRFSIVMAGDIQVLHRDLEDQTATLVADRLEAVVQQDERVRPEDQPAAADASADDGLMDLGGPMRLEDLLASGRVVVHTPTRDVSCDEFDYDEGTGMARLTGRVDVMTESATGPLRADSVLWSMRRDTVTILNASGG